MKKIIWIIGLIILFSGCSSDDDSPKTKQYKDIVGIWVPGRLDNTGYRLDKSVMEFRSDRTARLCFFEDYDSKTDTYIFTYIREYHDLTFTLLDDDVYTLDCKFYIDHNGEQLEFSEQLRIRQIENGYLFLMYDRYIGEFSYKRVPSINVAN